MKITALFFLFAISTALFAQKENNDANYWAKHDFYHLSLRDDKTFFLEYFIGYHLRYTWGYWEKDGKEYHLKGSFNDLNSIPVQVKEVMLEENDSITFVLRTNAMPGYSLDKIQLLLDSVPFDISDKVLKVHSQYKFSEIRLRAYCDYSDIDSGYIITPYVLNDEVLSEEYRVNSNETNYFEIQWDIDGKIFNYEPIERLILKEKLNKLFWVQRNVTFSKSRRR
ncbi:MAG: hypothetical protein FD170_1602 [Bacteroidetes bacterium]|nr:MAG: hypothetical protein FD170_1602 [Bacteroidota bacterium]